MMLITKKEMAVDHHVEIKQEQSDYYRQVIVEMELSIWVKTVMVLLQDAKIAKQWTVGIVYHSLVYLPFVISCLQFVGTGLKKLENNVITETKQGVLIALLILDIHVTLLTLKNHNVFNAGMVFLKHLKNVITEIQLDALIALLILGIPVKEIWMEYLSVLLISLVEILFSKLGKNAIMATLLAAQTAQLMKDIVVLELQVQNQNVLQTLSVEIWFWKLVKIVIMETIQAAQIVLLRMATHVLM